MKLMQNLITEAYFVKPNYEPKHEHFRIDIHINGSGRLCIIAYCDNNYVEWVSLGKISYPSEIIGNCIIKLIKQTPLNKVSYLSKILNKANIDWDNFQKLWISASIEKQNEGFIFCGDKFNEKDSAESIGEKIVKFYNNKLHDCNLLEINTERIISYLTNICSQLKNCAENYGAVDAYFNSQKIPSEIDFENLKCLSLSENEKIQTLYKEYLTRINNLYNNYMNVVR
jgi:hypothetical protein